MLKMFKSGGGAPDPEAGALATGGPGDDQLAARYRETFTPTCGKLSDFTQEFALKNVWMFGELSWGRLNWVRAFGCSRWDALPQKAFLVYRLGLMLYVVAIWLYDVIYSQLTSAVPSAWPVCELAAPLPRDTLTRARRPHALAADHQPVVRRHALRGHGADDLLLGRGLDALGHGEDAVVAHRRLLLRGDEHGGRLVRGRESSRGTGTDPEADAARQSAFPGEPPAPDAARLTLRRAVLYWLVIYTPPLIADDVLPHGGAWAWIILDWLLMGLQPFGLVHLIWGIVLGLAYTAWSGIFAGANLVNSDGEPYIYDVLNWNSSPGEAAAYALGSSLAAIPICYVVVYLTNFVRKQAIVRYDSNSA